MLINNWSLNGKRIYLLFLNSELTKPREPELFLPHTYSYKVLYCLRKRKPEEEAASFWAINYS